MIICMLYLARMMDTVEVDGRLPVCNLAKGKWPGLQFYHIKAYSSAKMFQSFSPKNINNFQPMFYIHCQWPANQLLNQNNMMNILALASHQTHTFQSLANRLCFYASKMQASSTQKTKDSAGRRLGIKVFGGQEVYPNDIIARQRGFKWKSGSNVIVGLDQTIHAKVEGKVSFRLCNQRKIPYYLIDVIPEKLPNRKYGPPSPYIYHPQLFPERAQRNHPEVVKADKYHVKLRE